MENSFYWTLSRVMSEISQLKSERSSCRSRSLHSCYLSIFFSASWTKWSLPVTPYANIRLTDATRSFSCLFWSPRCCASAMLAPCLPTVHAWLPTEKAYNSKLLCFLPLFPLICHNLGSPDASESHWLWAAADVSYKWVTSQVSRN